MFKNCLAFLLIAFMLGKLDAQINNKMKKFEGEVRFDGFEFDYAGLKLIVTINDVSYNDITAYKLNQTVIESFKSFPVLYSVEITEDVYSKTYSTKILAQIEKDGVVKYRTEKATAVNLNGNAH